MSATVVVLEDNEISREGTSLILRRAGYKVVAFGEGRSALDHCRAPCCQQDSQVVCAPLCLPTQPGPSSTGP